MQKVISIILSVLLVVSIAFGGITYYRYKEYNLKYEQLTRQLRESTEHFDSYKQCITEQLRESNRVISSCQGSIRELREGLQQLQVIFEQMENYSSDLDNS